MKEQKGITLIALVITIIVLLILAGVAISMLSGENGILRKAADAKEKTEAAQKQEEQTLSSYEWNMAKYTKGTIANKLKVGDFVKFRYKNSDGTEVADPIACVVLYNDSANGLQVMATDDIGTVTIGSDESLEAAIASAKNASNILQAEANKLLNTKYALSARVIWSNTNDKAAMNTWNESTNKLINTNVTNTNLSIVKIYEESNLTIYSPKGIAFISQDYGWVDDGGVGSVSSIVMDYSGTENDTFNKITSGFVPVFTLIPDLTISSGDGTSTDTAYSLDV